MKKTLIIIFIAIIAVVNVNAQEITIYINGQKWDTKQLIKAGDKVQVKVSSFSKCQMTFSVQHRSVMGQMDGNYSAKINQTKKFTSNLGYNPSVTFDVDDFVNNYTSRLIIKILDVTNENGTPLAGVDYRKTYSLYDDGGPKPNNKFLPEPRTPGPSNVAP